MSRLPKLQLRSVRAKLLLTILPVVALAIGALTLLAVNRATNAQEDAVYREAAQLSAREANRFEAEARESAALARGLATLTERDRSQDRAEVSDVANAFLLRNPALAGTYLGFEPNAFDGRDGEFAGDADAGPDGRFAVYWGYDADNRVIFQAPLDESAEYWQMPKETKRDGVVEPYLYEGVMVSSYASPVMRDGRFIGVAQVDKALTALDETVRRVRFLDSGYAFVVSRRGQFVSFPDRRLVGITTLQEYARRTGDPVLAEVAAAVRAGRTARFETKDPRTGEDVVMFTAPVATGGWGFVTVAPVDEILAEASSLRTWLLILGLVALIVVGAVVWLVAQRITRPIAEVAEAADRISRGDLEIDVRVRSRDELGRMAAAFRRMVDYLRDLAGVADSMAHGDLSKRVQPKSDEDVLGHAFDRMSGELRDALGERSSLEALTERMDALEHRDLAQLDDGLRAMADGDLTRTASVTTEPIVAPDGKQPGRLAQIFNGMLGRAGTSVESYEGMRRQLGGMLDDISRTSAQVSSASQQMAATSEEAGRAVNEIAGAIADVAQGAERQVTTVGTTRQANDGVRGAVSASTESAQATTTAVGEARTLAEQGAEAVSQASEAMQAVRASSEDATEAIRDLGAKSERIGGIVETIGGIADQTNLLALNAAIEAARAGEQGRGFAVVAEEVRKLAEESQDAAATIAELIGEIRRGTARAVQAVEAGAERTSAGVATVEDARNTFRSIRTSVEDVHARVEEINHAIERIESGGNQVRDDLGSVAAIAEQTSAATQQVSASTQQTSAATQEIAASAQELAKTAEELEKLAARFTLA
ncbi:methyl-accepting chemotaxis protein [Conexibacter woesei]|uniref:Methyl-accepting chemotaxis sensory transducer with Cache sensor n=1 Tax=Conexibacter woesei (strain DSM 14684 / CCUG 47730 / CIP 108061 / JCM 11494 / NBRC 100937 / ID131577) TaxID=469383 RepID=D3FCF6_CONWI|nr:methyl-accepting chemotaxis protein [Conexibacter woesei]ADB49429.1 methyl-accepting chemotaxis sensory transducer with Cache sensor [Conexibacter woesei DSM 14684]